MFDLFEFAEESHKCVNKYINKDILNINRISATAAHLQDSSY